MSIEKLQQKPKNIEDTYKWLKLSDFMKIDTVLTKDVFFKVPRIFAQMMGIWPGDVLDTKLQYSLPIFTLGVIMLCSFTQWSYVYKHLNSAKDVLTVVVPSTSLTVSLIKSLLLLLVRKRLYRIMSVLHYEWYNNVNSKKYEAIHLKWAKWSHLLSLSVFLSTIFFVILTTIAPIGLIIYQFSTGQPIERRMGFLSAYPFDIESEPGYEIAYLFITFAGLLTTFAIVSNEGQFATLCMYITAQFQIVKMEIDNLIVNELGDYTDKNSMFFSKSDNDKLLVSLSKIVQKHIDTITLCNDIVAAFIPVIILHFITAAMTLCASCIGVMILETSEAIANMLHAAMTLAQLLLYCVGGASILECSTQVSAAVYDFHWYKTDTRVRKLIQLMIIHSQNGTKVKVPFFEVSAPIYLTIVKTAGSYIALMKSFM